MGLILQSSEYLLEPLGYTVEDTNETIHCSLDDISGKLRNFCAINCILLKFLNTLSMIEVS